MDEETRKEFKEIRNDLCELSNRVTALEQVDTTTEKVHDDYTEHKRYGRTALLMAIGLTFTLTSIILGLLYYKHII